MIVATTGKEFLGVNVYLKPTYAVVMPARSGVRGPLTELQKNNLKHLRDNAQRGVLSKKATRRLVNSVNWLVASAKKKWVYDKVKKKHFSFKVNFVTLTLPSEFQIISDHRFKSVLLHNFINQCRYHYGLKNFVWKVEAQANGKIHAHFTTDTYLPWKGMRRIWNKILHANGLLDMYIAKHSSMTFDDYCRAYNPDNKHSLKLMKRRFEEGQASGWTDPNSTDVHAVYKVKDIGAYLAKYMSKDEEDRRLIEGRLWSCNYNIAQANKLSVNVPFDYGADALDPFIRGDFHWNEIFTTPSESGIPSKVGEIYFFKISDLFSRITGPIGEMYRQTLFNLREGILMNLDQDEESVNMLKQTSAAVSNNVKKAVSYVQLYLFEDVFDLGLEG